MKEITVGRKHDNDVVLNDSMVGRCVAKVIKHEDGHFSIVDLSSTNGVYVNGTRIPAEVEVTINNHDFIHIGNTTLNLEEIILRARLRGLSIDDSTFPPPNNAMCYCPPPPEEGNGGDDSNEGCILRMKRNWWKWILALLVGLAIGILITFLML